ncbi:hypothetical protein UlMin_043121 [Ulmus minor]
MDSCLEKKGPSRPVDQDRVSSSLFDNSTYGGRNVFGLIAQREISPRTKHIPRRHWGETSKRNTGSFVGPQAQSEPSRDSKHGLLSWVEAESLRHLSANYCPLVPPPRSTIAAAFSPDGSALASTHGDHTVKLIDCQTGSCLKVLSGHRRTPWVVRFHPLHPEILASGSLDHEVRLWDSNTSECIRRCDFYRPIASIAFHAKGELLAVASGHKLYIWNYNENGEPASPTIVLKTRRSLRAVHFHPHGAPFLLTAEVNDLDSSDSLMTRATSLGYLRYPPPVVFMANFHSNDRLLAAEFAPMSLPYFSVPSFAMDDSRTESQQTIQNVGSNSMQVNFADANAVERNDNMVSTMHRIFSASPGPHSGPGDNADSFLAEGMVTGGLETTFDAMETDEMQPVGRSHHGSFTNVDPVTGNGESERGQNGVNLTEVGQLHHILPYGESAYWGLPFLQGWLMGQNQAGLSSMVSINGGNNEHSAQHMGFPNLHLSVSELGNGSTPITLHEGGNAQLITRRIESVVATSLAAAAAAELPCTVKLRLWAHDISNPCGVLSAERCRLTIPHAVLCSEMGAHFSPCGRFLAACVACVLPHTEADPGLQNLVHQDPGAATSPTRHPISAHQVIYELRIYSLEEATFGKVLVSRAIRAAHCLTSIQFSPTSEHILLAYGRRHVSLLKSIVLDGETTLPIYTVLEVYRVSDMELVRVLPSAEDEVNVACFHPFAGGGLVYGTKEGKLRILQYDGGHGENCTRPN